MGSSRVFCASALVATARLMRSTTAAACTHKCSCSTGRACCTLQGMTTGAGRCLWQSRRVLTCCQPVLREHSAAQQRALLLADKLAGCKQKESRSQSHQSPVLTCHAVEELVSQDTCLHSSTTALAVSAQAHLQGGLLGGVLPAACGCGEVLPGFQAVAELLVVACAEHEILQKWPDERGCAPPCSACPPLCC